MPATIRIKLKAFDHRLLDQSVSRIVDTIKQTGAVVKGPVPLPTKRSVWTVNRGPNIDKKAREQFEMRIHKRLIDVVDYTPRTMDALREMDVPSGIAIDVTIK
ncbi:MAG: 30S ribosomal protein S10 [Candidatus Poribacteria bacterium]|nr:MAG: 30S ribosomal protein S10 [Candidatus Poribacteria bacterium]